MQRPITEDMKRLNHLSGEMEAQYHEAALKLGLSDSASRILYTVSVLGDGCPLSEIRRLSGISKQTINSALRKLEAEKILYLTAEGSKRKTAHLTDAGRTLVNNTVARLIEAENEIFGAWEKSDREKYIELTEQYLNALKKAVTAI